MSVAREGYDARMAGVEYHHSPYSYVSDRPNWWKWTMGWKLASLRLGYKLDVPV
jgi:hypothetical protein